MILSARSITKRAELILPFHERTQWEHPFHEGTLSYGLSYAGYDIRLGGAQCEVLRPGQATLAVSLERFNMPLDLLGSVADKSSLARRFIAVQNTKIEPGWRGYLTLEISNHGSLPYFFATGQPIAQVIFELLDEPTAPYDGKYQDQGNKPTEAL